MTLSYRKAVKAAGTKDSEAVAKKLEERPVDDAFAKGKVLANGRATGRSSRPRKVAARCRSDAQRYSGAMRSVEPEISLFPVWFAH